MKRQTIKMIIMFILFDPKHQMIHVHIIRDNCVV